MSPKRVRGASLVEVMVAAGFAGLLATLVCGFTRSCLRSSRVQQARSDSQETAALALDLLACDLRAAGYGETAPLWPGLTAAEPTRLSMRTDLNGDGDADDANETVAYGTDAAGTTLTRASGNAPPQPLASSLEAGSLHFSYFDTSGEELTPGAGSLDEAQRAAVCRVDIAFTVAVPSRDSSHLPPARTSVRSSVVLRNAPR